MRPTLKKDMIKPEYKIPGTKIRGAIRGLVNTPFSNMIFKGKVIKMKPCLTPDVSVRNRPSGFIVTKVDKITSPMFKSGQNIGFSTKADAEQRSLIDQVCSRDMNKVNVQFCEQLQGRSDSILPPMVK